MVNTVSIGYARVFLFALLLGASVAALAGPRAGYVSIERVLRESMLAQRAQRAIDTDFAKRDQERAAMAEQLERMKADLEKDLVTLSDSNRAARERAVSNLGMELQRKQREFSEDLGQRRSEELANVMQGVGDAVKRIAEAEDYDIVFQEAVWIDPGIDITDKVIKMMNEALQREPAAK